ncbi:MAG: hypothetical protein AAF928_09070 [Myxococcota bacterium]
MARALVFLFTLIAATGCGSASMPKRPLPAGKASPSAPPPLGVPATNRSAPVTPASTPPASPFHVVAITTFAEQILRFEDALVAAPKDGGLLMPLERGHAPAPDERVFSGLPWAYRIVGVAGKLRGPSVVATEFGPFMAGTGTQLYRRNPASASSAAYRGEPMDDDFQYVGVAPWRDGRTLALSASAGLFPSAPYYRFRIIDGGPAPLPRLRIIDDARGFPDEPPTRGFAVRPFHFVARESGEFFTIGHDERATDARPGLHVERWKPGSGRTTIEALPVSEHAECKTMDSVDDGEVLWLLCSGSRVSNLDPPGFLLALRDNGFASVPLPPGVTWPAEGAGLAQEPSGQRWLAAGGLWRREDRGWVSVPLPRPQGEPLHAFAVDADADGSVWVLASDARGHRLVLHTEPSPRRVPPYWEVLDSRFDCPYATLSMVDRKPLAKRCLEPYTLLRTFDRVEVAPTEVADIVGALRGHSDLVTSRPREMPPCLYRRSVRSDAMRLVRSVEGGRTYFGARVPDVAMAERVAELVRRGVPGAAPETLCHRPDADAELIVDLASGVVEGWSPNPNLSVHTRPAPP